MIGDPMILLPILLPAAGGFFLLLAHFKNEKTRNILAEAIVVLTSVIMWSLLLQGSREAVTLFSFANGYSLSFHIDGLSMLFAGMVSFMWPLVMLYAFSYMRGDSRGNSFFSFYVMTFGITLGLALSANILTMYVFFEMLTLVTIPLVCHYQDRDSMFAGRLYAAYVIGGASLGFFAVIVASVYGGGAFCYGGSLAGTYAADIAQIAFLLGFFGFGVKAAVFPLHVWLPVASVAPTPVTALLHAVAVVNSGVFAIMRLTWYSFGPELIRGTWVQTVCLLTASFTLVFAAVQALRQRHFKRRLAYSTVSNLSYMLYGVMLLTPMGFQGGMAHMLFHGIIKMSLFLCAGAFMHVTGKSYIYEINGVGRKMPFTFIFYTLGALSLTGIPLFCGFVSKWQLLTAGLEAGGLWAFIGILCLIAAAFLCAMYTLTVSIRAFFPMKGTDNYAPGGRKDADLLMLAPIAVFGVINIVFGVYPGPVMSFLEKISQGLL